MTLGLVRQCYTLQPFAKQTIPKEWFDSVTGAWIAKVPKTCDLSTPKDAEHIEEILAEHECIVKANPRFQPSLSGVHPECPVRVNHRIISWALARIRLTLVAASALRLACDVLAIYILVASVCGL